MARALVLSGGGSVGIAWQTGLLAGMASKGVSLADADFILGTSAGSAVGARLALGTDMGAMAARYAEQRAAPRGADSQAERRPSASTPERMQKLMAIMAEALTNGAPPEEQRAAIGRFALEAETPPEDRFIAGFSDLADHAWPAPYACTAVDAESGAFVVWSIENPAPLERAVASSCAVPGLFPPITINGRRYIDGGMRSGSNADLAKDHERVLLITLMAPSRLAGTGTAQAARYAERSQREQNVLIENGCTLHTIGPDDAAAAVMGMNLMDPALGADAAAAGVRQGEAVAAEVADFWS